jgi:hypothetical protein
MRDYANAFSKNWFNPSIETLALLRKPVFFVFIVHTNELVPH